jgi:hypothetical protein
MKSKGNGTVEGANAAEAADKAQGRANLAANLAAEVAAEVAPIAAEEPKTRGRKPSNRLTFAKFAAGIKAGGIPDGVKYVPQRQEGGKVIAWAGYESEEPVMQLDENGNLSLTRLFTQGRAMKPTFEVIGTIPASELLTMLNSRK